MDFDIMKRRQMFDQGVGPQEAGAEEAFQFESPDFTQNYVPTKDPSEIKDDELRQSYLSDKWEKEQKKYDAELGDARKKSDWAGVGDVIGGGVTDIANAQRKGTLLYNRMQDLGRKHDVIEPEQMQWQKIQPMYEKAVDEARQGKKDSWESMKKGIELKDYQQKEKGADPASAVSKQALLLYQSKLLAKAAEADAAGNAESANKIRDMARNAQGLSAAELQGGIGDLKDLDWKDIINSKTADKRLEAAQNHEDKRFNAAISREDKKAKEADDKASKAYTMKLGHDYNDDDITKSTVAMRQASNQAEALASDDSGKSDMALIYSFAKSLDPSVVKEGEYAMYSSNQSLQGRLSGLIERAKTGKLEPDVKKEILQAIRTKIAAQEEMQKGIDAKYGAQADYLGVPKDLIFGQAKAPQSAPGVQKPTPATHVGHGANLPPLGGK